MCKLNRYIENVIQLTIVCFAATFAVEHQASAQISFQPSWQIPSYENVRTEMLSWIEINIAEEESRLVAEKLWPATNSLSQEDNASLLSLVIETFAAADPRALALWDACHLEHHSPIPPQADWLEDAALSGFQKNNLKLFYARWLSQKGLYDEVLEVTHGILPKDVVDPAALLFYRMVAFHQLVQGESSRIALVQLMEQEASLPRRFQQVSKLVERDLASLENESLDHIARRMNDVRRRLDLGRAGKQVQMVEKGVVDSLDELIKKLEEQQKKQSSSSSGSAQSSKPMQDSRLPSMRAPMKVDQKDIGSQSGWGNLPEKEREKAMQQIGREFPSHYRELIKEYFRELASESDSTPPK